jgi:hypothetical protein
MHSLVEHKPNADTVVLLGGSASLDDCPAELYTPSESTIVIGISATGMLVKSDFITINDDIGIDLYQHEIGDSQRIVCFRDVSEYRVQGCEKAISYRTLCQENAWFGQFAVEIASLIKAKTLRVIGMDFQFYRHAVSGKEIHYSYKAAQMYKKYLPKHGANRHTWAKQWHKMSQYKDQYKEPGFGPFARDKFERQKEQLTHEMATNKRLYHAYQNFSHYDWRKNEYV